MRVGQNLPSILAQSLLRRQIITPIYNHKHMEHSSVTVFPNIPQPPQRRIRLHPLSVPPGLFPRPNGYYMYRVIAASKPSGDLTLLQRRCPKPKEFLENARNKSFQQDSSGGGGDPRLVRKYRVLSILDAYCRKPKSRRMATIVNARESEPKKGLRLIETLLQQPNPGENGPHSTPAIRHLPFSSVQHSISERPQLKNCKLHPRPPKSGSSYLDHKNTVGLEKKRTSDLVGVKVRAELSLRRNAGSATRPESKAAAGEYGRVTVEPMVVVTTSKALRAAAVARPSRFEHVSDLRDGLSLDVRVPEPRNAEERKAVRNVNREREDARPDEEAKSNASTVIANDASEVVVHEIDRVSTDEENI